MNIILGFGKTETDFEQQEFDFVEKFIEGRIKTREKPKQDMGFWFDDDFVKELVVELSKRKSFYDKEDKKFKAAKNYPDRYSTFSFDVLHNVSNLCVVFKFGHTNRRHPFSPDGWAYLVTKKVYYADRWDFT